LKVSVNWRAEILELHAFFEGWLTGALPQTERAFARVEEVLAEGFVLIGPDGRRAGRERILRELRSAHGSRPFLHIRIENPVLHHEAGELLLAGYDEVQQRAGSSKTRRSSAVFVRRAGRPNDMEWLHVHETWLGGPVRGTNA